MPISKIFLGFSIWESRASVRPCSMLDSIWLPGRCCVSLRSLASRGGSGVVIEVA